MYSSTRFISFSQITRFEDTETIAILQRVLTRVKQRYNVAVSEVGHQDVKLHVSLLKNAHRKSYTRMRVKR